MQQKGWLYIDLADFTVTIWIDVKDNTSRCMSLLRLLTTMWSVCQSGCPVYKAVVKAGQEILSPIREAKEVRIDLVQVSNRNTKEWLFLLPSFSPLYFELCQRKTAGLHTWVELPSCWFECKNCVKENRNKWIYFSGWFEIFPINEASRNDFRLYT